MSVERGIKETQEALNNLVLFIKDDPKMPEYYRDIPRTPHNLKIAENEVRRLERVLAKYTANKG